MINLSRESERESRHFRVRSGGAASQRPKSSTPVGAEHLGVEPIVETIGPHAHVVIQGEQVGFPAQQGFLSNLYLYFVIG